MQEKQDTGMDRRKFLRAVGGAAPPPLAPPAPSRAPTPAEAINPRAEETKARYNPESDDVKAFYRTNGYETLKK